MIISKLCQRRRVLKVFNLLFFNVCLEFFGLDFDFDIDRTGGAASEASISTGCHAYRQTGLRAVNEPSFAHHRSGSVAV